MSEDVPTYEVPGRPAEITPQRALQVLRAELTEERQQRGNRNQEAGSSITPDEYEQAIVMAIKAIRAWHVLP